MRKHIFPLSFIVIVNLIFFARLFFPEPHLYYTPDLGRSDIWNLNYPLKDFLSQSLKRGELPFWNKDIGTGFPVFAEGQVGTLFIPNLILFGLLPTWLAFNLSYGVTFITSTSGSYFFLIKNKLSRWASLFAGLTFSFGGFFITHISHMNLIQSASLMPWLFLTAQYLWENPNKKHIIIFSLLLSQQIFVGFPQTTFITLVGLIIFFSAKDWLTKQSGEKVIILSLGIALALLISLPQLLPTFELVIQSNRLGLNTEEIFISPFSLNQLILFLLPNVFGNPKYGTLSHTNRNWGIYWENAGYIGILPLIFLAAAFFIRKKQTWIKSLYFLLIVSLLLSFGNISPISFIYTLPGFNYFRSPSRFLLLTTFSMAALAGVGIEQTQLFLKKIITSPTIRTFFIPIITIASILNLFHVYLNYHPTVPVSLALKSPDSLKKMQINERVLTTKEQQIAWSKVFTNNGWQDILPYLYFTNGLDANINLLYTVPQVKVYSAMYPTRQGLFLENLDSELLNAAAIMYIVSPKEMKNKDNLKLIDKISPPEQSLPPYYVYENKEKSERFRFATNYQRATTYQQFQNIINSPSFSPENTIIVKDDFDQTFEKLKVAEIDILEDENQQISLKTTTDKSTILVIADSFYPGWIALVNGEKTKIYPANLNQRAIIIPKGTNKIDLFYLPWGFIIGLTSSITIPIILFWFFHKKDHCKK